ncbi:hypothetical protein [Bacillus cereus]|uniref:Uncharacterized protein n=1 Tax=Bacillus cereus VD184 TaxID=1053242 RepID=A0A9W5RBZ5_BACCE|nr:hypothetical protein [Bacillus cereus]HDR7252927.1 hypothetical protein [Bacillus pacificus]EOQ19757.1 hypothetical protein IKC_04231 [Bacillus cereus VD184]MBF8118758.1 hypothetical protein [Bacillus cereus]MCC3686885.1 hypothetical protein [Bacillus cereus]ONG72205.1 hypothetical protein BKK44_10495 [Bacillus cereus]
MFKKMFTKPEINPLDVLIHWNNPNEHLESNIGVYVLEQIKKNQDTLLFTIDISALRKSKRINTSDLSIKQISKDNWRLYFDEYTFFIEGSGFTKTPFLLEWKDSKEFVLTLYSYLSDQSRIYLKFYGNISDLSKEEYFSN